MALLIKEGTSLLLSDVNLTPRRASVDVRDYGATGDGVTDDTAAINAATFAAKGLRGRKGATVYFPTGTYMVSTPVLLYSGVCLLGAGWSLDDTYYNVSAIKATPGFTGSAIILQDPDGGTVSDPDPRPDRSWHWGVIERLTVIGNGISGPHGIDPGWSGEASTIRNVSVYTCNSAIYLNDVQASTTLESVSLFANSIGLNCDNIAGSVRVFGLSGDNNVNLVRVKGGVSANVTIVGMKAENYAVGTGDPVINIVDLAGGAFTLIGGWADTDGARTRVIGITQPGASSQRPKVLIMGFHANSLYTNLLTDTFDSHTIPLDYGGHPLIAYNVNLGVLGAGNLGIGYGRTLTGLEFGETAALNLVTSGPDNGTVFHAGTGATGGRLTNAAGDTASVQWRAAGNDLGFFGATPVTRPAVSGSRGGNAALASLITALANLGLVTDSSSA